jgi:hypothetical protein
MIPADDFRQIWNSQATSKELKGGDEMLATVIERTRNLDRKIAIRNTRECIAGALWLEFSPGRHGMRPAHWSASAW